ncbi:hypothetical protein NDU88_003863 [Pleurodeles waltl]|uniref:Androgen receptor n=1 Tax=Pleurodeles waltl TaxID=8319 RepID=A0AAV7KXP2_PLEWA|nr:hypothetical protein NDU88_003863 [Pleurodeles waltl]
MQLCFGIASCLLPGDLSREPAMILRKYPEEGNCQQRTASAVAATQLCFAAGAVSGCTGFTGTGKLWAEDRYTGGDATLQQRTSPQHQEHCPPDAPKGETSEEPQHLREFQGQVLSVEGSCPMR